MTMQRSLLLAAAVLVQVLLVPAAASRSLSHPFSSAPARRQLLADGILSGTDCIPPTRQPGCGFGSLQLFNGSKDTPDNWSGDLYWKQIPQTGGGYKLEFTVIPRPGKCLTKVVGIAGTTNNSTKLFYKDTTVVSPTVNAAAGTCWRWTTNGTLTYVGNILIIAHTDMGPCLDGDTTCTAPSTCQTTCIRTGNLDCSNVNAFESRNDCSACCPNACDGAIITTTGAASCEPPPPPPSCPVLTMAGQTTLTRCVQGALDILSLTCTAQDATSLEGALATAARTAGCNIPSGVTYKASRGITCTAGSSVDVTFTATIDGSSPAATCYTPVNGTFSGPPSQTCPSDEPVIADADASGVSVCSSDAEAVAIFSVTNPNGDWTLAESDFTATCPDGSTLKTTGGIVLAGNTVTVTCSKTTGWTAGNITLDASSIAGPDGCTADPAAALQTLTPTPAPTVDFAIASATDVCTETNTVTTVSVTGYQVTDASSDNLEVTVGGQTCTIASPAGPDFSLTCALTGTLTAGTSPLTGLATVTGTGVCNDETVTKSVTANAELTIVAKPTVSVTATAITERECVGEKANVTANFTYTSTGATNKITVTASIGTSAGTRACGSVDITTDLASGSSSVDCDVSDAEMESGATITLSAVAYGSGGCQGVDSTPATDTVTIPVDSKPTATITSTVPATCAGYSGSITVDFDYTSSNAASLNVTAKLGDTVCGTTSISSPVASGTGSVACNITSAADPTTVTLEVVATGSGGCAAFDDTASDSDPLPVTPLPTVTVDASDVAEPQCAGEGASVIVPFTWTADNAETVTVVAKIGNATCGTTTLTVGTSDSSSSVTCVVPAGSMLTSLSDILINATAAAGASSACAGETDSDDDLSGLVVSAVPSVTPTITPVDTTFCAGKTSFDVKLGWSQTNTANLTLTPGATSGGVTANCGGAQTITNPAASDSITVTCTFASGVTGAVDFSLSATGENGAKPCTSTVTAAPASITSVTAEGAICGTAGCGSMCLSGACVAASCNTAYGFPGVGATQGGNPQAFACTPAPPSASGACPATAGTAGSSCCSWGDLKYSNWGWTNFIAKGSAEVCEDVYAGAAQNTISKGRNVGRVCYTYRAVDGKLNYTYALNNNVLYNDVQVYAGTAKPPSAPGKFTHKTSGLRNSNVAQPSGTFSVTGSPVWVAFHITVGDFPTVGANSLKTGLKKPTKKKTTKKIGHHRRSLL